MDQYLKLFTKKIPKFFATAGEVLLIGAAMFFLMIFLFSFVVAPTHGKSFMLIPILHTFVIAGVIWVLTSWARNKTWPWTGGYRFPELPYFAFSLSVVVIISSLVGHATESTVLTKIFLPDTFGALPGLKDAAIFDFFYTGFLFILFIMLIFMGIPIFFTVCISYLVQYFFSKKPFVFTFGSRLDGWIFVGLLLANVPLLYYLNWFQFDTLFNPKTSSVFAFLQPWVKFIAGLPLAYYINGLFRKSSIVEKWGKL